MSGTETAPPARGEPPPLFERAGARYLPTPASTSPWGDGLVGGAMLSALLAHGVEGEVARLPLPAGQEPLRPARLTVDLIRPGPQEPLELEARVERAGRRLAAVDASLSAGGRLLARARSLWLRPSEEPPGRVARLPERRLPGPGAVPADPPRPGRAFPDPWERRTVRPRGGPEPAAVWIRLQSALAPGLPASRFVRAAAAADFANPQGNQGEAGLEFVNADISLTLHRLPRGEWMLAEAVARGSEAGIAVASCALADADGRFGASSVASLARAGAARAGAPLDRRAPRGG